jgi:hypothetical protein
MSDKKIKIKVEKVDQLMIILKEMEHLISKDKGLELELWIPENKETISYITHSPYIQDWDFMAEKICADEVQGILKGIEPRNWNDVGWVVEAVWGLAQKSPAILYQSNLFWGALKQKFEEVKQSITPEHVLLSRLGEVRYKDWSWDEVDQDLTQSLGRAWKGMSKISISDLAKQIYG